MQVVESCAVMLGALSQQRLLSIVARLLREVSDAPGPGDAPRLRSDSPSARQEIIQICRGMKHVRLPLGNGTQVHCGQIARTGPVRLWRVLDPHGMWCDQHLARDAAKIF